MTRTETLTKLLQPRPDIDELILEDDIPLDSFYNEKQQRLLAIVFYTSVMMALGQSILAGANVALVAADLTPLAPDLFLSVNVTANPNWWDRKIRSYIYSEFGKPPDVVIEVISPTKGGELTTKKVSYANYQIPYYVVYDPLRPGREKLYAFVLVGNQYEELNSAIFPDLGLGLTIWEGEFEGKYQKWLRWCYPDGSVLPTPQEIEQRQQWELAQKEVQHQAELAQKEAEKQAELAQQAARYRAELAQKEAEKEAELRAKEMQYQALLLKSIALTIQVKFPDANPSLLAEITALNSVERLEVIVSHLPTTNTITELRQLYQS